jgi:hypothetical protein
MITESVIAKGVLVIKKSPIFELLHLWQALFQTAPYERDEKPAETQPIKPKGSEIEKLQVDANAGKFRQLMIDRKAQLTRCDGAAAA